MLSFFKSNFDSKRLFFQQLPLSMKYPISFTVLLFYTYLTIFRAPNYTNNYIAIYLFAIHNMNSRLKVAISENKVHYFAPFSIYL